MGLFNAPCPTLILLMQKILYQSLSGCEDVYEWDIITNMQTVDRIRVSDVPCPSIHLMLCPQAPTPQPITGNRPHHKLSCSMSSGSG